MMETAELIEQAIVRKHEHEQAKALFEAGSALADYVKSIGMGANEDEVKEYLVKVVDLMAKEVWSFDRVFNLWMPNFLKRKIIEEEINRMFK